jgi:hypothetical protein
MNTRKVQVTLTLALALTVGCTGLSLGTSGDSGDDAKPSPDLPHDGTASADPDEADDDEDTNTVSTPSAEPDVAPHGGSELAHAVNEQASCLTFFTAEEGSGSDVEGALAAATSAPRLVFLNRAGGRYTPGRNNSAANSSSIPKRNVAVAPYEGTNDEWNRVVSCVKDQFASYNVTITDQDPGNATYIEAVVGDGPQALDLDAGVGGISPFTCGVIERSIVYVFSKVLRGVQSECEVIAHEVGHSLGLEHEYLCEDPMTYLHGCGEKTFQDRAAQCGTYSAVNCTCGKPTQNTVEKLLANVGPALDEPTDPTDPPTNPSDSVPQVAVLSPQDGATLPGNSDLSVTVQVSDDKGIADVRLYWEFNGTRVLSCANAQPPVECDVESDRVTFTLPVGTGPRAFTAEAVDTANQRTRAPRVTLTLADDQTDLPPEVSITSPSDGSTLERGGPVSIRVSARDDSAVRQVTLTWQAPAGAQTFRLDNLGNGTFGVDLTVSTNAAPGRRTLNVTAMDDAGQTTTSSPVSVDVQ